MVRRIALFLSCLLLAAAAAAEDGAPSHSIRIGPEVLVSEATDGALSAIGGHVVVDARVEGPLRAAGGQIEVRSNASVEGDASLAGGSITVRGPVHGDLHAAGGHITLNGPVTGDAFVGGGSLTLGPEARIDGKLVFRGGELQRNPAAQVAGGIEHTKRNWQRHEPTAAERFTRGWAVTAGLLVLAAVFAGAMPGSSRHLAEELRERPWLAALLGFIVLTAVPAAAVLLMITIIGIPVGLLALLLYAALLLAGYVWLAVVVGGLLLDRFKADTATLTAWRVGAAVLTMLVLAIMVRMPWVGGLVKLAALTVGVGMIAGAVLRRAQPTASPQGPAA